MFDVVNFSYDGFTSYTHPNSTFTHYATTLSSIDNQVVAVGSGVRYSDGGKFSESNNKGLIFEHYLTVQKH